jgi:hypothetical protein
MSLSPTLPTQRSLLQNPRAACIVAMSLVFLCGAVVGALVFDFAAHKWSQKAPFWTDAGKAIYMARIQKELDLTPVQTEQMESILDDFAKYYRTVLSDGKARIIQILNDDQKRKFEKLLQERGR